MSSGAEPIIIDALRVGACAITLWAGPDNKPAGWPPDVPITAGDLPHPRAFVSAITYDSRMSNAGRPTSSLPNSPSGRLNYRRRRQTGTPLT